MEEIKGIIIGAVLGVVFSNLVTLVFKIIKSTIERARTESNNIIGKWHIYTCIRDCSGNFIISHSPFKIKFDIFRQYRISSEDQYQNNYKGYAKREEHNLILYCFPTDKNFKDHTYHRISLSPIENYRILLGTYISTDYGHKNCAGISILTRTEVNEDIIKEKISEHYVISEIGAISIS